MADLATAIIKRGSVKSKLTNFSKFVKKVQDKDSKESVVETDLIQLKERLKTLEHVKYEFDEIQGQIEMFADNADLESQYAVRSEFEDEYFAQITLAKKIIHDNDDNSSNASSSHNTRKRVDTNYEVAWNALLERYDNNKLLIHNHIKALFNGESIHRENASGLRKLIDDFSKNLRALEQLKQPVKEWDALLVYIISTKLDNVTLREWENAKADLESPKFNDIKHFLNSRADMLEMVAQSSLEKPRGYNGSTTRGFLTTEPVEVRCVICGGSHYAHTCKDILKLTPMEREKKVRILHLCINCLKKGHHSKVCRRGTCNKCNEKHHTLLHSEPCKSNDSIHNRNDTAEKASEATTTLGKSSVTLSACGSVDYVFLSTAYVQVTAPDGSAQIIRALLDCGAQSSFVTKGLIKLLKCEMNVQSLYNNYSLNQWFFVIDTIAGNIPAVNVDVSKLAIPDHINLADPTFFKPNKIDMLIGSDRMFWGLLCGVTVVFCFGSVGIVIAKYWQRNYGYPMV
ncbi:hypothetical protein NQ318_020763 [Aromia moschata]|uniref:Peptidase aspartic putative domain-containing protein n=1 Tax=Aromia moschata TaxID=1265417 RepID=A0AAV8YAH7_9CUCU|nr:hypothetical protein NQ318_020763 [Aromia moschata]